jgi:hypothetical protein
MIAWGLAVVLELGHWCYRLKAEESVQLESLALQSKIRNDKVIVEEVD